MSFLVILLLLAVQRFSRAALLLRGDGLLLRLLAWVERQPWLGSSSLQLLVLLAVPVLPLLLLERITGSVLHGLLLIPLELLVILWALGGGDPRPQLQAFRRSWQSGDVEAASLQACQQLALPSHDAASLLRQVQGYLFWHCYQSLFAVLFCYALGGAALALVYRLLVLLVEHSSDGLRQHAAAARQLLDWLPARLLALSLALAGNFTAVSRVLGPRLLEWNASPARIVVECGRVAADLPATAEAAIRSLDEQWALLVRAAIVWYCSWALWVILIA